MNCQYYDNNFETCTNGDCPFCSDFCPVTENQEICRYSGLDETETMLRNCLDNEERESRETIQALAEENQELKKYQELGDYDRLRELAQADRDGRCVVMPCNVGDSVYEVCGDRIDKYTVIGASVGDQDLCVRDDGVDSYDDALYILAEREDYSCRMRIDVDAIGDESMVYTSHEQAEAALKEREKE